jgi:hypothetical protein
LTKSELPPEVRDLVMRRVHSMEEIEVLLLLAGDAGPLPFAEILDRLRLTDTVSLRASLSHLIASGLLACDDATGRYAYAARDARTRNAVDLLRIAYNERPVTLVRLVYSRPSQAQSFADAFRLNKDGEP